MKTELCLNNTCSASSAAPLPAVGEFGVRRDEAVVRGQGDAIRPLGGDSRTFIAATRSRGLPPPPAKNWNLITAAAHLLGFLC